MLTDHSFTTMKVSRAWGLKGTLNGIQDYVNVSCVVGENVASPQFDMVDNNNKALCISFTINI